MIGHAAPRRSEAEIRSLGDLVEFLDHKRRPITSHERVPGTTPYYGANGVQDYVDGFLFDEPLVLLAEDGGHFDEPHRGIAYGVTGKSWVNNHAHVLRPSRAVDFRYLVRVLEHYDARRFLTGSTRQKLTKGGASRMPIPVPGIEEQRRIAAILDHTDDLVTKRQQSVALLDHLSEAMFLDMFGDPLTNSAGWPSDRILGDIAAISSGITKGRRLPAAQLRSVPYLAVANVQVGRLQLDTIKRIDATEDEIARYRLQAGDIVLTEGGDPDKLGRGTVWADEIEECIHQNHIFRVRVTNANFEPSFVSKLLASERGRRYFLRSAKQTTGIASINKSQLRSFPMLQPPVALQQAFVDRLRRSADLASQLKQSQGELEDLFSAVRQRAFAGAL